MKNLLLPFICCLWLIGQAQQHKLDAQLKLWVKHPQSLLNNHPALYKKDATADVMVSILFRTTSNNPVALVKKHLGQLHSILGTICTAELPLNQIEAFANHPEIIKIESAQPVHVTNQKGMELMRVDSVKNGLLPEQVQYSGKDVIVGIVDTGIDFLNADFREKNDSTQTRIIALWDQTALNGTPPNNFNYGAAWNAQELQQALTNPALISQKDYSGHGTHVAGTAAGLRGLAHNALIVAVKTPLVSNGDYRFSTSAKTLDAVKYVYDMAAQQQKACVVNMSIGFNFGAPHDGTSLFEQGLDYLAKSRWGFAICVSAGNEGQDYSHHGNYQLSNDSVWTYINALNGCTWYGVNESINNDSMLFSVIMDSAIANFSGSGITHQTTIFQSPWFSITELINANAPIIYPILYGNGDTASTLTISAAPYDSARSEWYVYTRDYNSPLTNQPTIINLFKIAFKGKGSFHAWMQALNGYGVNIPSYGGKTNARYKASDNAYNIGIPGTSKEVITVGAYINQKNYVNLKGQTQVGLNTGGGNTGTVAFFTSRGPTTDNRIKPDISAPGLNVASTYSVDSDLDSNRMTDANTIVFSGTSMASPMAAGAVALLLEKFKFATNAQIKDALQKTAVRDLFVPAVPNNTWGYGKLNLFSAMKTEVTSLAPIIYKTNPSLQVYPNPTSSVIYFEGMNQPIENILIQDITGKIMIHVTEANNGIDVSALQPGLYFYQVLINGSWVSGKFLRN